MRAEPVRSPAGRHHPGRGRRRPSLALAAPRRRDASTRRRPRSTAASSAIASRRRAAARRPRAGAAAPARGGARAAAARPSRIAAPAAAAPEPSAEASRRATRHRHRAARSTSCCRRATRRSPTSSSELVDDASSSTSASERPADRRAVETFYAARNYAPLWIHDGRLTAQAKAAIAQLKNAADDGLDAADYPVPEFGTINGADALADGDVKLTDSVLTYVRHLAVGRIAPTRVSAEVEYGDHTPDPDDVLKKLAERARRRRHDRKLQSAGHGLPRAEGEARRVAPRQRLGRRRSPRASPTARCSSPA